MSGVRFKRDTILLLLVSHILARAPHVLQALLVLEENFVTKEIEESHCVAHGHRDGCQQSVTGQTIHNLDISLDFLSVPVQVALGKRDYIPPSIVQKAVSCGEKNLRMFFSPKYLLSLRLSVNFRESYLVWLCPEGDYHSLGIVLANQLISSFEQVCFRSVLPRSFCPK